MEKPVQYKLINPDPIYNIDFLNADEICSITPISDNHGGTFLLISYEDPEFCVVTTVTCDGLTKI